MEAGFGEHRRAGRKLFHGGFKEIGGAPVDGEFDGGGVYQEANRYFEMVYQERVNKDGRKGEHPKTV